MISSHFVDLCCGIESGLGRFLTVASTGSRRGGHSCYFVRSVAASKLILRRYLRRILHRYAPNLFLSSGLLETCAQVQVDLIVDRLCYVGCT